MSTPSSAGRSDRTRLSIEQLLEESASLGTERVADRDLALP